MSNPPTSDLDAKQFHELAAELGNPLPNSVLAALSPQDRDRSVQRWEQRRNWGRGRWASCAALHIDQGHSARRRARMAIRPLVRNEFRTTGQMSRQGKPVEEIIDRVKGMVWLETALDASRVPESRSRRNVTSRAEC